MDPTINAPKNSNDAALLADEIRLLQQEKEALQADVAALKHEKAQLSREVQSLRTAEDDDHVATKKSALKKSSSMPDLSKSDLEDDDDDEDDGVSVYGDELEESLSPSERLSRAPQHFLCPLTLSVMKHPMQQKGTNKNYERGAILEWIYFGSGTCPLTRQKLHPSDFEPNAKLQQEIQEWRESQGMPDVSEQDKDLEASLRELLPNLTPQQEREQQERLSKAQGLRRGSTHTKNRHQAARRASSKGDQLLGPGGLKDRILQKREDRILRHFSQH